MLTFICDIPHVVLNAFSQHRDRDHEDEREDGRDGAERRDDRDGLKDGHHEEVNVGETFELLQEAHGEVGPRRVLGRADVVGPVLELLVPRVVVQVEGPRLVFLLLALLGEV